MAVAFVALLDVTIVNIGLPSMQDGLDASTGTIQWVVSGYALTFGIMLVTGGRLGDAHGRRLLMLIGLGGFIVSSAACGLAPTATLLVVGRLVQGAFAGLLVPQNPGIIQTFFRGKERGTAFGMMGFTVGVSSATGPVLGGLIIAALGEDAGWRWLFLVNVPIGLILLLAIWRIVPTDKPEGASSDLDVLGAVLIGVAVVFFIYPVSTLEYGIGWQLVLLVFAPVFVGLTTWWERRCPDHGRTPILDIDLLKNTDGYLGGVLLGSLYFTGFSGVLLTYSMYLQKGLGYAPLLAGLLLIPFALANAVSAPVGGRLVNRLGRRTTVLALLLMMLGMVASAMIVPLAPEGPPRDIALVVTLFVTGCGAGAVVSPNMTLTLANVPPVMAGAAGAALQTGQRMGGALGSALMLMIYELIDTHTDNPGEALQGVLAASLVIVGSAFAVALSDMRQSSDSRHEPLP